jgi:hypothetical protein
MSQVEQTDKPSLVRSLMQQSPTLGFLMRRRQADGSIVDFPFRVQLLRSVSTTDILADAQKYAKARKEIPGYTDIYKEAQAVALVQACMCHDTLNEAGTRYLPYFVSSQQVRESLDETEIAQVVNCYEITKSYFGFGDVDEETVEALIDNLADEFQGPFFLSQFASEDWPRIIYFLARLAQSWRPETPPTSSHSPDTSESNPENSPSGTGGFSELPVVRSSEDSSSSGSLSPPTDRLLTRQEAREVVKKANEKRGK